MRQQVRAPAGHGRARALHGRHEGPGALQAHGLHQAHKVQRGVVRQRACKQRLHILLMNPAHGHTPSELSSHWGRVKTGQCHACLRPGT